MKSTKRLLIAVVATLVLSGAAVTGVVMAQTPSPTLSPTQQGQTQPSSTLPSSNAQTKAAARQGVLNDFLNQVAQNLNINRSTLDNAMKSAADHEVGQAVTSGTLTSTQGNAIKQRIDSGKLPFNLALGRAKRGKLASALRACKPASDLVSALGISQSQLAQARKSGQTIAQIAQTNGKTLQGVQNTVASSVKSCLDPQVTAGTLTQQQENAIVQRIQQGHIGGGRHAKPSTSPQTSPTQTPGQ